VIRYGLGDTPSDWWDKVASWFDLHQAAFVHVGIILGAAIVVWILGRLAIRGVIQGIREGLPRNERGHRRGRRFRPESTATILTGRLEAERRQRRADTIGVALRSVLGILVIAIALVTILAEIGIKIGPLLAAAGILGVALGFGAQSLVKDLLSGMFILFEDQYGVGDNIDLGEAVGTVEEVGLRITRLRSLNGTVWFVPNGEIRRVGNQSRLWSRALVEIRIDSGVDVDQAESALLEAATAAIAREEIAPSVIGTPTVPGVESITRDAIVLRVFVRVHPGCQWDVERAIREEIQRVFRKRKIRLAVSANQVYMDGGE
jgi:small conductance mechanosensitive channel